MVLCVDKERGVIGRWTHVLTIVDKTKEKLRSPPPKWMVGGVSKGVGGYQQGGMCWQ